ncbi:hypothetical protein RF11_08603 [Thelohanellus kitauei]|uniref:Uncharacterized protein n=1 Tax=Thelohanellus kitauei TaxID=669202 RepID=A0A0C2NBI9_THEKT|nr:hypothetical protein RF11_08603 [Thelohanellus kitauei]
MIATRDLAHSYPAGGLGVAFQSSPRCNLQLVLYEEVMWLHRPMKRQPFSRRFPMAQYFPSGRPRGYWPKIGQPTRERPCRQGKLVSSTNRQKIPSQDSRRGGAAGPPRWSSGYMIHEQKNR